MNLHAVRAIYWFEMSRTFRTLTQSIISPVISTSLYFVVFGSAIGSRMTAVDGVQYAAFIVPGLIMLSLLTQSGVQWQINNAGFDPNRVDVRPRLGTSELWQWHNPSNRVHPMHLHGMLYRVVERSSGVIHPGERSWKDTVGVLPGETVTVQPWFAPYAGRYVFHCHALEHGDKAMMLQLEVVK